MTLKFVGIPAMILAAATLGASPAFAQRAHNRGEQSRGQSDNRGQSENRGQARERGSAERGQPRAAEPAPAPRAEQRAEPQRAEPRRGEAQRAEPQRAEPRRGEVQRAEPQRVDPRRGEVQRAEPRRDEVGRAVPRVYPRVERPTVVVPRYDYRGPRWEGYRGPAWYGYRGYSAFRPYYFRPWYRLGFSIHVGYPVAYYAYPYPVPVYGYGAPYGTVYVGPNNYSYGGVALNIQPDDAFVYVDGGYAGIARDFDGTRQPLTLTPGQHHIEVDQNGFEPLAFDVNVQPGMVIPYEGALRPY